MKENKRKLGCASRKGKLNAQKQYDTFANKIKDGRRAKDT